MPHINLVFKSFQQKKDAIKAEFRSFLIESLLNDDCLPEAFNDRGIIQKNKKTYIDFKTKDEVMGALQGIINNEGEYTLDFPERKNGMLIEAGFSSEEIESLDKIKALQYEAIICHSLKHIFLSLNNIYPPVDTSEEGLNERIAIEYACKTSAADLLRSPHIEFQTALSDLKKSCTGNGELEKAGMVVYNTTLKEYKSGKISVKQIPVLTRFISGTTAVLEDPQNEEKIKAHAINTEEALGINKQWGKMIGGAMLVFLGVALIGASLTLSALSLGTLIPFSAVGSVVGIGMIGFGSYLVNEGRKREIALSGELFHKAAFFSKSAKTNKGPESFEDDAPTQPTPDPSGKL